MAYPHYLGSFTYLIGLPTFYVHTLVLPLVLVICKLLYLENNLHYPVFKPLFL